MRTSDPERLWPAAAAGDRRALGRLLSLIEAGGTQAIEVAEMARPSVAPDQVVGITGAPGAGKSTLTAGVVRHARRDGERVGVLAVDPTSPITGGAILGDRVRMQDHAGDRGVFIRSMATRGHLGGLSLAVPGAVRLLAAAGYRTVVIETVGVGQVEVEVAGAADTTVVVVNPGWGDSVQVAKAGLLEVGDLFVVNKADRPGAAEARRDLAAMLDLDPASGERGWTPPVLLASATSGEGLAEIWEALGRHRRYLADSGEGHRRRSARLVGELDATLARRLSAGIQRLGGGAAYREAVDDVLAGRSDPASAADRLLAATGAHPPA